jgi:hypothetical protein
MELNPQPFDPTQLNKSTTDQFGQVYKVDDDQSKWSAEAPQETRKAHNRADVDVSPRSMHHTLGPRRNQASPGNHTHDGSTSKRIIQIGSVSVSFTSLQSTTINVTFPTPYPAGVTPFVWTNIATGDGNTARWGSRAITITNTGFTLFLFQNQTADGPKTWTNFPVNWMATV